MHESSEGLYSTTIPKPRGNEWSAQIYEFSIMTAIGVSVSVTPDQITVIDVPPSNSFTLTCAATAASNTSAMMVFTWSKRTLGTESSANVIHNGHSVVIITSGDTSTLTTSETQSGGYVYSCNAMVGDGEASSDNAFVSVGGTVIAINKLVLVFLTLKTMYIVGS